MCLVFYYNHYNHFVSENRGKKKSKIYTFSDNYRGNCIFHFLYHKMGRQLFLSIQLGIILTLFQYIILGFFNDLTNPIYFRMALGENFNIVNGYATSQSSVVFMFNIFLCFTSTILLMKVEKNLNVRLYWSMIFVPILFWFCATVFSFAYSSIYRMESLILFLIPIGYFIAFYYNYKMINKELDKKKI